MRCLAGVAAATAAVACAAPPPVLEVARPAFWALLQDVPVRAHVLVTSSGGLALADVDLLVDEEGARGVIPALPPGEELAVQLLWESGGTRLAESPERLVRLTLGATNAMDFAPGEYAYPDDDGDGARNLFEVVWAASHPEHADAAQDAALRPDGFFAALTAQVVVPGGNSYAAPALSEVEPVVAVVAQDSAGVDGPHTNHAVHLVELETRRVKTMPMACEFTSVLQALALSPLRFIVGATACGDRVHYFNPLMGVPVGGAYATTPGVPATWLHFARSGELYAIDSIGGAVIVLGDGDFSTAGSGTGVLATLPRAFFGVGSAVQKVAELDGDLVFTDGGLGGLVVVRRDGAQSHQVTARVLGSAIGRAKEIEIDADRRRAYVGDIGSGDVVVVDLTGAPDEWRVAARIPAAPLVFSLALEPVHRHWLYVSTPRRLSRVNTVTFEVEWTLEVPDRNPYFGGVAVSSNGRRGLVMGEGASFYPFGSTAGDHIEREPNHLEPGGTLAAPGLALGWGDANEVTPGAAVYTFRRPWGEVEEDVEDLWAVTAPPGAGRLAVALFPATQTAAFGLVLFDAGAVVDRAGNPTEADTTYGTGVFLVTPPLASWPAPLRLGVDVVDAEQTFNYGAYELVAVPVPDPLPRLAEVEPNHEVGGAQLLPPGPVIIDGVVDTDDVGGYTIPVTPVEDAEDCFEVTVGGGRIGARLDRDLEAGVDIDLVPLTADGQTLGKYVVWINATTDYFIFAPHPQADPHVLCVMTYDADQPPPTSYTLTVVDFGP